MLKTKKLREKIVNHRAELMYGAEVFDILGNSCRLEMIIALIQTDELSSGDIVAVTHCTPSAVSQSLSLMKRGRMVNSYRKGRNIYYSFNEENPIIKRLHSVLLSFIGGNYSPEKQTLS